MKFKFHYTILVWSLIAFLAGIFQIPAAFAANEGPPIEISTADMDQQNPDVVALPDRGLWFVVWEDWRTAADSPSTNTGADVWGQFVDGDGSLCGTPFLISDENNDGKGDPGNQTFPSVAYDQGDGRLLVAWQDTRDPKVYARAINVTDCSTYTFLDEQALSYAPVFLGSNLLSRSKPRVVYDSTRDYFWLAWVEGRSARKTVTGYAFGCPDSFFSWIVGDTSFVGYAALNSNPSGNILPETLTSDIPRTSDEINIRLMSHGAACTVETITYEFFDNVNNVDLSVDPSSGEILLVWEGIQRTLTVTNTSDEPEGSPTDCFDCQYLCCSAGTLFYKDSDSDWKCCSGDVERKCDVDSTDPTCSSGTTFFDSNGDTKCCDGDVNGTECDGSVSPPTCSDGTTEFTDTDGTKKCCSGSVVNTCMGSESPHELCSDPFTTTGKVEDAHDGLVHIYGIHQKEIKLEEIHSLLVSDPGSLAYMPSVKVDPVTGRFLVAWEDLRDGALYTKIYGQLVYAGGGLYNTNFIVGYQDTNGDGEIDESLRVSRQTSPYVGYDHTNQRFFVAWQDGRNGSVSVENLDIYGQYIDAEGSLRGSNYLLSSSSGGSPAEGNQYSPAIAFNMGNHLFLAVWKDARNFLSSRSDIYGQRFTVGQPQLTVLNVDNSVLSPALIDFGSRLVGEEVSASFKVRNTGDVILDLQNFSAFGTNSAFEYVGLPSEMSDGDQDGITLVPSGEFAVTVAFSPTAAGSFHGDILISSDAGEMIIHLQGLGLEQNPTTSSVSVNPSEISFGSVAAGDIAYQNIVMQNDGGTEVNLVEAEEPSAPFSILGGPSTGTFAPGSSLNFTIKFAPETTGTYTSRIVYIFQETNPVVIEISGECSTTTDPPSINLSTRSINFGTIDMGITKSINVQVTNNGGQAAEVLKIDSPAEGFSISNFTEGQEIAPGESVNMVISFSPTDAKEYRGTVDILFAHQANPVQITVSGKGQDPANAGEPEIVISSTDVTFADTMVNTTRSFHQTVTNTGTGPATLLQVDKLGDAFDVNGLEPGLTIGPGEVAHSILIFTPPDEDSFDGEIALYFQHQMNPEVILLHGQGVSEEDYQYTTTPDQLPPWMDLSLQEPEALVWIDSQGSVQWQFVANDYAGYLANRYLLLVTPWIDPWTGGLLFYSRRTDGSFIQGLVPEASSWPLGPASGSAHSLREFVPQAYQGNGQYYLFYGVIMPDHLHAYYSWITWVW